MVIMPYFQVTRSTQLNVSLTTSGTDDANELVCLDNHGNILLDNVGLFMLDARFGIDGIYKCDRFTVV